MSIMAIVPAYNEEKSIFRVVSTIRNTHPEVDVVVVNDGSRDNTSYEARRAGAHVIDLPCNLGIGGAVQTGYIYGMKAGYDVVVQIDGDGQHNPTDLGRLLDIISRDEADMVIGSRFIEDTHYNPGILRGIGIRFFSRIVSMLIGLRVSDTTSGYRAVNRRIIEAFAKYYPSDYPEVETIVYISKKGFRIREIPVHMSERKEGKSSITPIKSIYYMLKVTLSLLLQPSGGQ
jgi:glycosyltransferase involved in cell wall biosynthesis